MNQFPFQGTEEALDAGFVLAIPFSRHADSHASCRECLLFGENCLLTAAIRMVEKSELWMSSLQCHVMACQAAAPMLVHDVSDDDGFNGDRNVANSPVSSPGELWKTGERSAGTRPDSLPGLTSESAGPA